MNAAIREALAHGQLVDITTTGRTSGEPRRIELVYHVFDGRIYISGMPAAGHQRHWLRNLQLEPRFTFHLTRGPEADLPATARVITDPVERRDILAKVAQAWKRVDTSAMEAHSPLIEILIDGYEADRAA